MANNLYMPLHPVDYLTDTVHLTTAEHGAYLLLIMNYWQRGGALPADDKKLRGATRMSPDEWAASRETILDFFEERDGNLYHKRIDAEIATAKEKSEKARANAKLSHSARIANAKQTQSDGKASAERMQSECLANQDQDQDQDQVKEEANASSSPDEEDVPPWEVKRRLEEATRWTGLPGAKTIDTLISEGFSFENRILPLAREEAERRSEPPKSWAYIATVVRDKTRNPTPSAKPVEMAWVPTTSPVWKSLCGLKRESLLRQMVKPGPGGEGIYWPVADLPPRTEAAA
jgi:uncharacterized protein YdaU (DUF1376 family)